MNAKGKQGKWARFYVHSERGVSRAGARTTTPIALKEASTGQFVGFAGKGKRKGSADDAGYCFTGEANEQSQLRVWNHG